MLLKFKTRVGALLHSNDEARTAFEREFDTFYNYEMNKHKTRCTYAFIVGAISTTIIYVGVFMQMRIY